MKYAVVMFVCCLLALASAAPQLIAAGAWPFTAPIARTVVAGPTVWNGAGVLGGRIIAPGYVGTAFI